MRDDVLQADEGTTADEQDVRRVDLHILLLRVLPATLRGHVAHGALDHLEEGLLYALAAHVPGDGDVGPGLVQFVHLIDVDDTPLRRLDVEVRSPDQLQQQVLHVLTDVAGFRQRRSVTDGERDMQEVRQGTGQQRLAGAGWPQQQDVGLIQAHAGELRVIHPHRRLVKSHQPLVVVDHSDGQLPLGRSLADDGTVEMVVHLTRGRDLPTTLLQQVLPLLSLEDAFRPLHALATDVG